MAKSNDEDYHKEFVLRDFEQQYQEYRHAETSRIHYVQFLISLVIAVLAFFAALYQTVGFPAPDIYPLWVLLSLSIVLFIIGLGVKSICISTRVSQMNTARYINDIGKHFFSLGKDKYLEASRETVYFAEEGWDSKETPFFKLMKIIAFLLSVLVALSLFSLSRITFWIVEVGQILPPSDFPKALAFWDYLTWSNSISIIAGLASLIVTYTIIKSKIRIQLRKEQKKADESRPKRCPD